MASSIAADIAIKDGGAASSISVRKLRTAVNYDVSAVGQKGSLNIPGVFKGSEEVVKDPNDDANTRVLRSRSVAGGLAQRKEEFAAVKDDKGALDGLVRTFKTQSNPLRTRTVSYDLEDTETGVKAAKRELDVRLLNTNVGYKYTENNERRQYTQIRAVAYSLDVKDNQNAFKKQEGLQQKDTSLLGVIKRRYDVLDGKEELTGRQNLAFSKYTEQKSATTSETTISRLGGFISKTYEKPVGAAKDQNDDKFITNRRIGTYTVEAKAATQDEDATKTQKIGKNGTLYSRTVTIPREGDEKTVQLKILGVTANRTVKLTEDEKALRARQLPPLELPDASASQGYVNRGLAYAKNLAGKVNDAVDYARKNPVRATANVLEGAADFISKPISTPIRAAAGVTRAVSDYNQRTTADQAAKANPAPIRSDVAAAAKTQAGNAIDPTPRSATQNSSSGSTRSSFSSVSSRSSKSDTAAARAAPENWGRVGEVWKAANVSVQQGWEQVKEKVAEFRTNSQQRDSSPQTPDRAANRPTAGSQDFPAAKARSGRDADLFQSVNGPISTLQRGLNDRLDERSLSRLRTI